MLVCIDLSRLYFALRSLNVTINYEGLIDVLKNSAPEGEAVRIEAFTTKDPKNSGQKRFLGRLQELGVNLHTYDYNTVHNANFSAEIATEASFAEETNIMVVSNDSALIRVFSLMEDKNKKTTLCFFSEKLEGSWAPTILRGAVNFLDLSNPDVRSEIVH